MHSIDKTEFSRNLLLTQAYCEPIHKGENIASALRTFNPEYNGQPLFSYKFKNNRDPNHWVVIWSTDPVSGDNQYVYDELYEKQLKYKFEKVKDLNKYSQYEGRILVAEIDCTFIDGASEEASEGCMDINDCPPIDTWFYMLTHSRRRILFAWIPQQFVHFVDEGIAVNCVNCFRWYDEKRFSLNDYSYNDNSTQPEPKRKSTFRNFIKDLFK